MTPTVSLHAVSKWFGDLVALSDVSFDLAPGVTALLGPNGAGKSTLLRILCGLTPPSRGDIRVLGMKPGRDLALHERLGLVPQQDSLPDGLSALAFVTLRARLHRLSDPVAAARNALGLVELDPDMSRPVATFSKGMRQRVKLAGALVHDPEVVVLDEPLEGLDPRQRLRTIDLVRRIGDQGRTVIVSSHVLDEVERFGSRVLVIAQGRLAAEGDFRAIRDLMDDRPHRLRLEADRPHVLAARLLEHGHVTGTWMTDDRHVVVDTLDVGTFRRVVAATARAADVRLAEVVPLDDDLESVFRYLVERRR